MKHCPVKRCKALIPDHIPRCEKCEKAKERVKLNRLKLFERDPSKRGQYNEAAKLRKREKRRLEPKPVKTKIEKIKKEIEELIVERSIIGYTLFDLPDHGCRFAVSPHNVARDEHRFCGEPASGSYCTRHKKLMLASEQAKEMSK